MDSVEGWLLDRFGREPNDLAESLRRHWRRFRDAGLADRHFASELCSGCGGKLIQRYWEVALGNMLLDHGLNVSPSPNGRGPDFCVKHIGRRIWIEAVALTCGEGPGEFKLPEAIARSSRYADKVKTDEYWKSLPKPDDFLLRYMTAIDSKCSKFISCKQKNLVHDDDLLVIAINVHALGPMAPGHVTTFDNLRRALYSLGDAYVRFSADTETLKMERRYKDEVAKSIDSGSAPVRTAAFIDDRYADIGAVIGSCVGPTISGGGQVRNVIFHNKPSAHSIDFRLLPSEVECEMEDGGKDWQLTDHWHVPESEHRVYSGYEVIGRSI